MINSKLFVRNRQRFCKKLKPNSIAVFNSNDFMPTSADGTHPFIQQTDILYLSGIDQEETLLVICPDTPEEKQKEILFIKETKSPPGRGKNTPRRKHRKFPELKRSTGRQSLIRFCGHWLLSLKIFI
jgi:hypothetical protein